MTVHVGFVRRIPVYTTVQVTVFSLLMLGPSTYIQQACSSSKQTILEKARGEGLRTREARSRLWKSKNGEGTTSVVDDSAAADANLYRQH